VRKKSSSFVTDCRREFRFLESEFGFSPPVLEQDRYRELVLYRNATTFVRITNEPREGGIFVLIGRLVDGNVPPYPASIRPETRLHMFYLPDFKPLRSEGETPVAGDGPKRSELARCAEETKKYAADVLRGDFSIFPMLDRQVKARLAPSTE
jgi:hypothetical protein